MATCGMLPPLLGHVTVAVIGCDSGNPIKNFILRKFADRRRLCTCACACASLKAFGKNRLVVPHFESDRNRSGMQTKEIMFIKSQKKNERK